MTNPIVQSVVADALTSGNEISKAYVSAQTAGNCNVLFAGWDDDTSTITGTPTDSSGNIYRLVASVAANNVSQSVYVCDGVTGIKTASDGTNTVTVVWSTSAVSFPELYLVELAGPVSVDELAFSVNSSLTSPTLVTSAGPVTSHYTNQAFLAYCFTDSSAQVGNPGPGWTYDTKTITGFGSALQWQIAPVIEALITGVTNVSSDDRWCQSVLGFYTSTTSINVSPTDAIFFGIT